MARIFAPLTSNGTKFNTIKLNYIIICLQISLCTQYVVMITDFITLLKIHNLIELSQLQVKIDIKIYYTH